MLVFGRGGILLAQYSDLNKAIRDYKEGKLVEARNSIDKAVEEEALSAEPTLWYLRGFIYKDLYKMDTANQEYREISIDAFIRLMAIEQATDYHTDAHQNLKFLCTTYYNEAITALDAYRYKDAINLFDRFKATVERLGDDPFDIKNTELEFYLALGSRYTQAGMAMEDTTGTYSGHAVDCYEHVLTLDSENLKANYNIGVIYYNQAVQMIADLDYDQFDLIAVSEIEDHSIALFKRSLPYMEMAHRIDPDDPNTLEGLAGIHFSLRDFEASNKYSEMLSRITGSQGN
jgi:tetratricopeptide (TPR) repeat protein